MDYSKLLQHCRDEHGVNIDASDLAGSIRKSIWKYFSKVHNLTLHDTELWDILECLQEQPKPGNPPPIVATMKDRAFENIKSGEEMESASWYAQSGVLLSNRDALEIVEFCERVNAQSLCSVIGRERAGRLLEILRDLRRIVTENLKLGEPLRPASWYKQEGVLLHNETARDICDIFDELFKGVNAPDQLPEPVIYPRPDWESIDTKFNYVAVDDDKDVFAFSEKPQFRGGLWKTSGEYEYLHEINFGKMLWERPGHGEKRGMEHAAKVAEIMPDYGTGFRPPWDVIAPEYVACAVYEDGSIFFYSETPTINEDNKKWKSCDWYCPFPSYIKAPVENWRECLWIRPGHREKEGAE